MTVATKQQQQQSGTGEWLPEFTPASDIIKYATAQPATTSQTQGEEGYYGVPMLKKPKWRWEIALYFFFEGISAGAFLLAALSDLFGKDRYRDLQRAGYATAIAALLPCPPLLISDLGRPERFHHMLRVFKPSSPMNLGSWALSGYSLTATPLAARQLTGDGADSSRTAKAFNKLTPARPLEALGIPFALTMLSYPGVLLSTTSTPIWSRSRFLGALMACSSMSNGIAATTLALSLTGNGDERSLKRLEKIEHVASLCEGAALAAYLTTTEDAALPLTKGHYASHLWLGAVGVGLLLPVLMRAGSRKTGRTSTMLRSAFTLVGGLALKWALTHAGRESAVDTKATRNATRPTESAPGWGNGI
jgi:formate-dependent nitrite reductase membrane component NrfD